MHARGRGASGVLQGQMSLQDTIGNIQVHGLSSVITVIGPLLDQII